MTNIYLKVSIFFIFIYIFIFIYRHKSKKETFKGSKMSFLFGKKKTPEEMLRQNQRALNKAMRDLDRERTQLENQEKKVIMDIKKMAKMGQMVMCYSGFKLSLIKTMRE